MKILIAVATLSLLGLSYPTLALEYDFENHPSGVSGHASVVEVGPAVDADGEPVLDDEGNQMMESALVFSSGSRARQASNLHAILNAYGAEYDFENAPDGVKGYASVTTVGVMDDQGAPMLDDEGNLMTESTLVFANGHKVWTAAELHEIFSAYGLALDAENPARVDGYITGMFPISKLDDEGNQMMDDKGEPMLDIGYSFSSAHVLWTAPSLHNILTAYQKT